MPNHIKNIIHINADKSKIEEILSAIKADGTDMGSIDFNKLKPMPEFFLKTEAGSMADRAAEVYLTYINPAVDYFGPKNDVDLTSVESLDRLNKYTVNSDEFFKIYTLFNDTKRLGQFDPFLVQGKIQQFQESIERCAWQNCHSLNDVIDYADTLKTAVQEYGSMDWYGWSVKNWGTKWNAYDFAPYSGGTKIAFSTAWSGVPEILTKLSEKFPEVSFEYSWADEDIGHNVGTEHYQNGEMIDCNIPENGSVEAYEMAAKIREKDLNKDYGLYLTPDGSDYEYREEEYEEDEELEV